MRATACLLLAFAAAREEAEPAIVLAATLRPVAALPVDDVRRRLGATTESLAAQLAALGGANAKTYVVVGTDQEKKRVEMFGGRVFGKGRLVVEVVAQEAPRPREAYRNRYQYILALRSFKIAAILQIAQRHLPLVYLDNDALFRGPLLCGNQKFTAPARWRGDAGSSPLDRARTAASSPRNDSVKNIVGFTPRTG